MSRTEAIVLGYATLFPGLYTLRDLEQETGIPYGTIGRWVADLRNRGLLQRGGRLHATVTGAGHLWGHVVDAMAPV
jgi:hypothetical protein